MNPLDDRQVMSARAIPVLETVIKVSQSKESWAESIQFSHNHDPILEEGRRTAAFEASQAIWVDALSVPNDEPARTVCLQGMGEIYSSAHQVFAVLTGRCADILKNLRRTGKLAPPELLALEGEDWINRAWTYQEAVNSRALYFVAEGNKNVMISGHDFLNALMKAIDDYKLSHKMDNNTWAKRHPRVYQFEAVLADYRIADYATRSAYQVMSVMDQRVSKRDEDHHDAMIGAITTLPSKSEGDKPLHPSEYLMRVCEEKGDFSFIYSTAPRSEALGQRWRPIEGNFPTVLPGLVIFGSGQAGFLESTHLQLDNMCRLRPGAITSDGLKAARWFIGDDSGGMSPDGTAFGVLERLRALGFTGCGEYIELKNGYFFPQAMAVSSDEVFVVVSRDIDWVTGGPGLLLSENDKEIREFCDVGAFVGRVPKFGESIKVG